MPAAVKYAGTNLKIETVEMRFEEKGVFIRVR